MEGLIWVVLRLLVNWYVGVITILDVFGIC